MILIMFHAVLTVGFIETSYAVDEDFGTATFCFTAVGNFGPETTTVVDVTSQPFTAEGTLVHAGWFT